MYPANLRMYFSVPQSKKLCRKSPRSLAPSSLVLCPAGLTLIQILGPAVSLPSWEHQAVAKLRGNVALRIQAASADGTAYPLRPKGGKLIQKALTKSGVKIAVGSCSIRFTRTHNSAYGEVHPERLGSPGRLDVEFTRQKPERSRTTSLRCAAGSVSMSS